MVMIHAPAVIIELIADDDDRKGSIVGVFFCMVGCDSFTKCQASGLVEVIISILDPFCLCKLFGGSPVTVCFL